MIKKLIVLSPIFVFLILFLGTGFVLNDFYAMSALVAFLVASIYAFIVIRGQSFEEKLTTFIKGASDHNILYMCFIFLFAGIFSEITASIGGADAFVKIGLNLLPTNYLIFGLFLIAAIISLSMGTSVGTISALAPIGVSLILNMDGEILFASIVLGAIVGGSMFGDNLSIISDTTIAATKTQGCEMKDKFKTNLIIVLPGAIITSILLIIITRQYNFVGYDVTVHLSDFIKIIPYILVLGLALLGVNVFFVLLSGIVLSGIIGFITGDFIFISFFNTVHLGVIGMEDLVILTLLIAGTVELIKVNGGLDVIIQFIRRSVKSKKGAELGIAAIASFVDMATANNTVAIVVSGPVAKEISDEFNIDPRRSASILDIFTCAFQGLIPYGYQLLLIASIAVDKGIRISPINILPFLTYPQLLLVLGLLAILFNYPKLDKRLI